MLSISEIRYRTGVLDETTLVRMQERFGSYCNIHCDAMSDDEAWAQFSRPVGLDDFAALAGVVLERKGKKIIFKRLYHADAGRKPLSATVHPTPRFGNWEAPFDVPFPVSADLRIRCEFETVNSEKSYVLTKTLMVSYNELSGLCEDGRDAHWSDTDLLVALSRAVPTNSYDIELNGGYALSDPLYRVTLPGQPKVSDILQPGMKVRSSRSDNIYVVARVTKHVMTARERPVGANEFEYFCLFLIDDETGRGGYAINELVAVDGRIKRLFVSSDDEVTVLDSAAMSESCKERKSHIQLSLF